MRQSPRGARRSRWWSRPRRPLGPGHRLPSRSPQLRVTEPSNLDYGTPKSTSSDVDYPGRMVATAQDAAHQLLTEDVALVDRSERGKLALTGPQAKEFLTGQV